MRIDQGKRPAAFFDRKLTSIKALVDQWFYTLDFEPDPQRSPPAW